MDDRPKQEGSGVSARLFVGLVVGGILAVAVGTSAVFAGLPDVGLLVMVAGIAAFVVAAWLLVR
ncbi:hypothetical protein [Natronorarus salvus]|uniref:hypothetical protein n=1 Tax=Natronorarus salvus TaxID=3117733 RepID=UPI002F268F24